MNRASVSDPLTPLIPRHSAPSQMGQTRVRLSDTETSERGK